MAAQIISASGIQYPLIVNPDGSININGTISTSESSLTYTQVISYTADGLSEYLGLAVPGTNKASGAWQIRKITYTGMNATDIQFANGTTSFDKVWNNRTGYTYS